MSNFEDSIEIIDRAQGNAFTVEVLAYKSLQGCRDLQTAQALFFAQQAGIRLKQVRIRLNQGAAILEASALHFMKGRIDVASNAGGSGGFGGWARGLASKVLTNETVFRPQYRGTGEIYLEPSFGHYLIYNLRANQSLIVDKGMFYCCEGSVNVSVAIQKNMSSGLLGGEGWFQTKVVGPGICVLASPVPASEVLFYDLQNEKLQIDGDFALMRTEGIRFSVQRSTKGVLGSMTGGEGLLQTFEGTGRVWLAPTQAVYDNLMAPETFERMVRGEGTSHTDTE